jgi:hypothetical protein
VLAETEDVAASKQKNVASAKRAKWVSNDDVVVQRPTDRGHQGGRGWNNLGGRPKVKRGTRPWICEVQELQKVLVLCITACFF